MIALAAAAAATVVEVVIWSKINGHSEKNDIRPIVTICSVMIQKTRSGIKGKDATHVFIVLIPGMVNVG